MLIFKDEIPDVVFNDISLSLKRMNDRGYLCVKYK